MWIYSTLKQIKQVGYIIYIDLIMGLVLYWVIKVM